MKNQVLRYVAIALLSFGSLVAGWVLAVGVAVNSDGIRFPDGTVQSTAAGATGGGSCIPIEQSDMPRVIVEPGLYCLVENLTFSDTSGNAIEIQTNDVTIDLNGYTLDGLAAGDGTGAYGIYAANRRNITLRNGTIQGFLKGVFLKDTSTNDDTYGGHLVEDLRLHGNTRIALWVEGPGNLIRRNQVVDTGGSTTETDADGIVSYGPGARILDNDVDGTLSSGGGAYGIYVGYADATIIQGNRVTETTSTAGGNIIGIYRFSGTGLTIEGNICSNASATGLAGILVDDAGSLCGNNRVRGFTSGIFGCTDAGGNFAL